MLYFRKTVTVENGVNKFFYKHTTRKTSRTYKNRTFRKKKNGGSVFIVGHSKIHTILNSNNSSYTASPPQKGKNGHNLLLNLPAGTCVYEKNTMKFRFIAQQNLPKLVLQATTQTRLTLYLLYSPPAVFAFTGLPQKGHASVVKTFVKIITMKQTNRFNVQTNHHYTTFFGINEKMLGVFLPCLFLQNGFVYNTSALRQIIFTRVLLITICCCRNTTSVVNFICSVLDVFCTQYKMIVWFVYKKSTQYSKFYYEAWVKAVSLFLDRSRINSTALTTRRANVDTYRKGILCLNKQCVKTASCVV